MCATDLAASLGGEFALALDGPLMPVPSWKLVSEVYDPGRFQATLATAGGRPTTRKPPSRRQAAAHVAQETVDGRTYYMHRARAIPAR